eukprot:TRINITY_DN6454_c0_g1_i1.p2 TRINITY_DN6454_c0_g1~~TRINITY_DN6454_c0_g1_i1.p2  ORF type:complete len:140 (+),score=7.45 TRINITY_DN6454_c0_g1_i1:39-422(+)
MFPAAVANGKSKTKGKPEWQGALVSPPPKGKPLFMTKPISIKDDYRYVDETLFASKPRPKGNQDKAVLSAWEFYEIKDRAWTSSPVTQVPDLPQRARPRSLEPLTGKITDASQVVQRNEVPSVLRSV